MADTKKKWYDATQKLNASDTDKIGRASWRERV